MEEELIGIAHLLAPHGVKGEIRAYPLSDFPERYQALKKVFGGKEKKELDIEYLRWYKQKFLLIKFQGINTREEAQKLCNLPIYVPLEEAWHLPEDYYYVFQLIGLDVYDETYGYLGKLKEIEATGANDVYLIDYKDKILCIPALKSVVRKIDLEKKRMEVSLPRGLID